MRAVLLADFGSTNTKLTAVDLDGACILGTSVDFTTSSSDIMVGFSKALDTLHKKIGHISFETRLACSSAAGGLNMLACGLVPSLTAKAARLAAFGAGAKVLKTYSYQLTASDIKEIDATRPDIFLLTGGTDGGNSEVILHNAQMLKSSSIPFPVVYAGNRSCLEEAKEILKDDILHPFYGANNVMPTLNKLNITPAQAQIRSIFLDRIIQGKGLSKESALIEGILMPTPAAVLQALTLLSDGTKKLKGIGEIAAVDLGGATTDIYSIAKGDPSAPGTVLQGLREPYTKRTVEGDIGMRYSAKGIAEEDFDAICAIAGVTESTANDWLKKIEADKSVLPLDENEKRLDFALASLAIRIGLVRHSGKLNQVFTPIGPAYQQTGKDLSNVRTMIATGGALIHSDVLHELVNTACDVKDESCLIPRHARVVKDKQYILSAMGLLKNIDEDAAFHILKNAFEEE